MTQAQRDQLCRVVHRVITRAQGDPITVTEKIADAVEVWFDMITQEEGIAALPKELQQPAVEETPWDIRAKAPATEEVRQRVSVPPAPKGAFSPAKEKMTSPVIALPGSKEFAEADPTQNKPVISAVEVRRKTGHRPGKKPLEIPQWEESDLIDQILKNTPEKLKFQPTGTDKALIAERNTHNRPGVGVDLTYKHPSVSAEDGFLVAKWQFSIFDAKADLEKALHDPERGIIAQLEGRYAPRKPKMEPDSGPDPGPLRAPRPNADGMGDSYATEMAEGERVADPLGTVMNAIRRGNEALTPKDARPRPRA